MDNPTLIEHFTKGLSPTLQEAYKYVETDTTDLAWVANWAIRKEIRMATIDHLKETNTKGGSTEKRTDQTPRNRDGTFRPTPQGDPMDLDATRRRPGFNISAQEYRRRMRDSLCLKCGKPGHRVAECRSQPNNGDRKGWQPSNGKAPWQTKPKIREVNTKEEEERSGNEESPQ